MSELQPIEHLFVIEDQQGKRTVVLEAATCSIGRDPTNHIVLDSSNISRHHALLLRVTKPGANCHAFRLIHGDLQGKRSTNGLFVNGRRCFSHDLQHGDLILFARDVKARYYVTSDRADIDFLISCETEEISNFLSNLNRPAEAVSLLEGDRKAEATLTRLASFPELAANPIVEIDIDGNITYLNPSASLSFPDISDRKLTHPILAGLISLAANAPQTSFVREVIFGNQVFEQFIQHIVASNLIRSYLTNITERKRTESALKESERRFRAVFDSMFQFIGLLQPDGILLEANQTALDFGGLRAEDVIGRPFWEAHWWSISSPTQARLKTAIAQAAQGEFIRYEVDVLGVWDTVATIDFSLKPVFDEQGKVVLLISEGRNITEKKEAQEALRQSEERSRLLVERSPVGIFQTDERGDYLFVNARWQSMTGLSSEEALDAGWSRAIHPDDRQRMLEVWYETAKTGGEFLLEYRFQTPQGQVLWVFGNATAIHNEAGAVTGYLGTVIDISDRKQVETLLQQSHQELEQKVQQRTAELAAINESLKAEIVERKRAEEESHLLQSLAQAIAQAPNFETALSVTLTQVCQTITWNFAEAWIPDSQDKVLQLSNAWYFSDDKLLPFREASQKLTFFRNVGVPGRVWAAKQSAWIQDVSAQPNNIFLRTKIAQEVNLKASLGVPIVVDDKVIAVFVFFTFDCRAEDKRTIALVKSIAQQLGLFIERKQAEDALRASMATNRALINAIPDWLFRISREGVFVNFKSVNNVPAIVPHNTFLGKNLYEVFPPKVARQIFICVEQALATNEVQILECQLPTGERLHDYELRLAVSAENEVMAIVRDITEEKYSSEELKKQKGLLKALLDNIPDVAWLKDRDGRFIAVNEPFCHACLLKPEEILDQTDFEIFMPEFAQKSLEIDREVMRSGQRKYIEEMMTKSQAGTIWIETIITPIHNDNNEAIGTTGISRDITQRKRVEEEIRNALEKEKQLNELKSRFVTMTSHEFRTPLATILSSAELVEHYGHKWSEEKNIHYLQRIQSAVKHITELMDDVLVIGKADAGKLEFAPKASALESFCRELVEEVQLSASKHKINFHWQPQCCSMVYLDEKLLRHILINLLSNAIKYSPQSDRVEFEVLCQSTEVIFHVKDYGIGIPEADREHLFDSFHRATNVGNISGTGLGLAIVKKAVDIHEGTIVVNSQVGTGTTVTVTLPCTAQLVGRQI